MSTATTHYRHPFIFYGLSLAIPWACWFAAAWASRQPGLGEAGTLAMSLLGLIGLAAPAVVAAVLIFRNPALRADVAKRFVAFPGARWWQVALVFGLMPASILAAQALSLVFGYSPDQFRFKTTAGFDAGMYPVWFILVLAPVLEELAWHTYGTDCLTRRRSLFTASMIFGVYWVLWHVPLGFIEGYYQNELVETGWLHSANFAVSIFPYLILSNWLYVRTGRSVLAAIVVHVAANLSNEAFATHPDSKLIQTGILLVVSAVVLVKERQLFFARAVPTAKAG